MKITEIVSNIIAKVNWLSRLVSVSKDFNGFLDRDTSTISVDGDIVKITFDAKTTVYLKGKEYVFDAGDELSLDVSSYTGGQYVVIRPESRTLEAIGSIPEFSEDLLCMYIYRNNGGIIMIGDERHAASADTDWHRAQHLNVGAVWRSGGAVGAELESDVITLDISTPMVIADEDLEHRIINGTPDIPYRQKLDVEAELPVLYIGANGLYEELAPSAMPLPVGVTAKYNDLASGTLVEAPEDSYICYFIVATNDMIAPIKWIVGRYAHVDIDSAKGEEFSSLGLSLPEIVPMNRIVAKTNSSFTNKLQFVENVVITNRMGSINMAYTPGSHESLLGRDNANQHTMGAVTGLEDALLEVNNSISDLDSANVKLTGNQTIAGVKTFSSNIVGNVTGNITGNAGTATKLATARTIRLTGDVLGSADFDGSEDVRISTEVIVDGDSRIRIAAGDFVVQDDEEFVVRELLYTGFSQDVQAVQAGEYRDFAMPNPKGRWLFCDGRSLSRTKYKELFEAIGTTYGKGNGVNTFNIPDRRGLFARTLDAGAGVDSEKNRALGSKQNDEVKAHSHSYTSATASGRSFGGDADAWATNTISNTSIVGGIENLVKNISVYTCIRY